MTDSSSTEKEEPETVKKKKQPRKPRKAVPNRRVRPQSQEKAGTSKQNRSSSKTPRRKKSIEPSDRVLRSQKQDTDTKGQACLIPEDKESFDNYLEKLKTPVKNLTLSDLESSDQGHLSSDDDPNNVTLKDIRYLESNLSSSSSSSNGQSSTSYAPLQDQASLSSNSSSNDDVQSNSTQVSYDSENSMANGDEAHPAPDEGLGGGVQPNAQAANQNQYQGGGPINSILAEVGKFDGNINFTQWYKQFLASCNLYGLTTDDRRIHVLKRCLTGDAMYWAEIRAATAAHAAENAAAFVAALTTQYQGTERDRYKRAAKAFRSAKKRSDETYVAYLNRLQFSAIGMQNAPGPDDIINHCKESTTPEAEEKIIQANPTTIQDLHALFVKMDEIDRTRQRSYEQSLHKYAENLDRRKDSSRRKHKNKSKRGKSPKRSSRNRKKVNSIINKNRNFDTFSSSDSSTESSSGSESDSDMKKVTKMFQNMSSRLEKLETAPKKINS